METRGVKRRKKGGWYVDTSVSGHPVKQGGFASQRDAAEWLWRLRTDRATLLRYLERGATAGEVVAQYLRMRGSVRYEQLSRHLLRLIGDADAATLRQEHVDRYANTRRSEGAAPKTAWNELCLLRTALRYAWRNDRLVDPPRFTLRKPSCARDRVAWPDEAQRIYDAGELPMRRVLLATYTMGLRAGELMAARWDWVSDGELLIPGEVAKTGREARVQVPAALWALLQGEPRHEERLFCRVAFKRRRLVVPWAYTSLRREWVALCRDAGVEGLRLHDLRRSMASVAQERGHAIDAVQSVGRWADTAVMVRHYSHASRGAARAVSEDLAGVVIN